MNYSFTEEEKDEASKIFNNIISYINIFFYSNYYNTRNN